MHHVARFFGSLVFGGVKNPFGHGLHGKCRHGATATHGFLRIYPCNPCLPCPRPHLKPKSQIYRAERVVVCEETTTRSNGQITLPPSQVRGQEWGYSWH